MSTLALESKLLVIVRTLLTSSFTPVVPTGLELVDGRLYMPVQGVQLQGFLMADPNRVAVVYDKTGNLKHNFQARDDQIERMISLLQQKRNPVT